MYHLKNLVFHFDFASHIIFSYPTPGRPVWGSGSWLPAHCGSYGSLLEIRVELKSIVISSYKSLFHLILHHTSSFPTPPQGDLYEGLVADSQPVVAPKGASEMEMRAKQLVKLLDFLEHHMIHELQRKIAREHGLVVAERARDEGNLPTDLWKRPVSQRNHYVPHIILLTFKVKNGQILNHSLHTIQIQ